MPLNEPATKKRIRRKRLRNWQSERERDGRVGELGMSRPLRKQSGSHSSRKSETRSAPGCPFSSPQTVIGIIYTRTHKHINKNICVTYIFLYLYNDLIALLAVRNPFRIRVSNSRYYSTRFKCCVAAKSHFQSKVSIIHTSSVKNYSGPNWEGNRRNCFFLPFDSASIRSLAFWHSIPLPSHTSSMAVSPTSIKAITLEHAI